MIYEFLTARGILADHHKKELIEKRGFTEDVIKEHRFFSGGKYLTKFEAEIISSFTEESLLSSGVFVKPERSEKIIFSSQLLDNRIIIPYLNKDNKAYFLRPHKMGLEVPIQIYHEKITQKEDLFAILTESEFKAVAGHVFGYRAIGVPGIGSFADAHFPKLVEFIQRCGIKKIVILFDNEIKDNPIYPNYKEDPFKRFDTEYFAYLLANNLSKEGIDCKIGRLPDSWRSAGKIDLDGALAQGKTKEDIRTVLDQSANPRAFIKDLPAEEQNILNRKLAKKYCRSNISVDWGKYVATRGNGEKEWQETISNFTIKVIARHETPEGVVREIVLIDEFGKHSRSFPMPSAPMVKRDTFADFVMNKGNYIWTGNNHDLAVIWQSLFLDDDGRHIIEPDHIGWIPDEKMFLFGNVGITADGEEVRPDKNNIFWRNKYGLKPVPISISSGKGAISEGIPIISSLEMDLSEIKDKFIETIGKHEAQVILGWTGAVLFMEEIFQTYNCFPFLFLTGRRGSGKSTLAAWVMSFFGIESSGKQASGTTPVAIQRYLGYYSSLPVFIDEYRNTKEIAVKNGFLRNVYNHQSAGKGIRSNFGVREGKIRGTLIVAGEETPDDNALLTRCVIINVKQRSRVKSHFDWFQTHRSSLSYLAYSVLRKKNKILPDFIKNLRGGKDFFIKKGLDDRMAINSSIIGSGYDAIFDELPKDFQNSLAEESVETKHEYDQEHIVKTFWNDILALQSLGKIREQMWDYDEEKIYIYFSGLYTLWAMEYRMIHGTEPFKESAVRKYLEEEPGFLDSRFQKKIKGRPRRCLVFDKYKSPNELKELIEEKMS